MGGVRRRPASETSRRFEAALESLDLRRRAALLLHDVHGLSAAGIAAVFAITEEAAGALLFRAREEFREAFGARSARSGEGRGCRQAEQAVAGAVGLGLAGDQLQRLRLHAAYCRPCRRAMRAWGAAPVGLAAVLETAPLPKALAAPPVFGATDAASVPAPRAGVFAALRPAATLRAEQDRSPTWWPSPASRSPREWRSRRKAYVPSSSSRVSGPPCELVTGAPGEAQPGLRQGEQGTAQPSPSVVTERPSSRPGHSRRRPRRPFRRRPTPPHPAAPAEGGPDAAPREVVSGDAEAVAGGSAEGRPRRGRSGKDKADERSGKAGSHRGRSKAAKAKRARSHADRASTSSRRASASRASSAKATCKAAAKSTDKADKRREQPSKPTKPRKPGKPAKPRKGG